MSQLPAGWANAQIGDVCTLNNGRAFKPTEWSSRGLPIVRIQNLNNPAASFNYFEGEFDQKYHLKGGELVFAWSGTPGTSFGAHVWRNQEAVLNQHIFRVDFNSNFLDKRFFRHAINQTLDHLIGIAHGGVGLRHVTKGKFEGTSISIPPVAEQKRIADKLDSVLARVDACRDRLDRLPALLKRFRQSILAAATSGRLTEDWREQQAVSSWDADTPLGELGSVSGGLTKNAKRAELTFQKPYLRVANVYANQLRLDDVATIGMTQPEFSKTCLKQDDLLIVEGNGSIDQVGRVAIWRDELPECSHQNHLIRWRSGSRLLPKFALFFLLSPEGRKQIIDVASSTTGLHTLSISKVSGITAPVPSVPEQTEIVRRVEILFAFADRLEARLASARRQVGQLTPALLAKAFRGELVAQDPADEPAAELLKRLAAQREAAPKIKRGRAKA